MNWKSVLRIVVCFVLICCLVINISPIKTEAVLLETVVTCGAVASMLLLAAGVVYLPTTTPQYEALGKSFQTYMYQWGTEAEKLDEVEEFFDGLQVYSSSTDDDDDDPNTPHEKQVKLARGLLAGIAAWVGSIILDVNKVKVEGEEAPEGYAYYNGHLLPQFHDKYATQYPNVLLLLSGDTYYALYTDGVYVFSSAEDDTFGIGYGVHVKQKTSGQTVTAYMRRLSSSSDSWEHVTANSAGSFLFYNVRTYGDYSVVWTCEDASTYEPITQEEAYLEAVAYLGDIPEQVQSGELQPEDIPLPEYIDYSSIFEYGATALEAITNISQGMSTGEITFDDYKSIIGYVPSPEPVPSPSEDPSEATDPSEEPEPDPAPSIGSDDLSSPVGDVSGTTFFDKLLAIITEPFKWIWGNIESFFSTLLKPEIWLDPLPEIMSAPAKWIWEKIETFFEPLLNPDAQLAPLEWIWGKIEPIPGQITEAVSAGATKVEEAVKSLVVPDEDYLTDKVNALCAEFAFADSIVRTAQAISTGLAGVTTEPPVIYIDLSATRGSYNIGGKVPFIDMNWYAEYKPTADALISAFLWICFVWRMLIHLPGIISGASGIFTLEPMPSTQTTPIGYLGSSNNQALSYEDMLEGFFSREPEDWLPGEYERYKANPPSYAELLEWGYGDVYIDD